MQKTADSVESFQFLRAILADVISATKVPMCTSLYGLRLDVRLTVFSRAFRSKRHQVA